MADAGQPAAAAAADAADAAHDAAPRPLQNANGGAPHSRPGAAAVLLAGLASRLSRAFAARDVPPQLAVDLARAFPGAVSVSVAVPLGEGGPALLALDASVGAVGDVDDAAQQSGLSLLPAAASAAGRCMASTSVVHAFPPTAEGGEQLADVSQHSDSHGAASLLLLPVPALPPQPAAGDTGSAAAADQPFQAAGVFGVGLGPDVPARRALVARAAYVAMALARTLDVDLATLRQEAAAAAAVGAPFAAAVPFQPAAAAGAATVAAADAARPAAAAAVGAPATAATAAATAAAAAAAAAADESPEVSDEDLDASDTERETEAAVAPYMARLSPTGPAPLQAIPEAGETAAAAYVLAAPPVEQQPSSTAAEFSAAPDARAAVAAAEPGPLQAQAAAPAGSGPELQTPVTRAAARRRRQAQQRQLAEQQPQPGAQPQQPQEPPRQLAQQQQQLTEAEPEAAVRVSPVQLHPQQPEVEAAAGPPVAATSIPRSLAMPASPPAPADEAAMAAASVPAEEARELMPWAKAEAMLAREQRLFSAGDISSATLRFVSPRLEAQFGAAHAAFLTHWVDTAATLLAFLYIAARLLAPAWLDGIGGGPLLMPAVATAGAAMWRLAEPDRYLQRREWALTAVRLAWLLHFAGGAAPQGDSSAAAAAPSSLADVAALVHLACADVLLVLSLLFPVRLQSMLLLGFASSALVVARAPLRACVYSSGGQPQAACVLRLLAAASIVGTLLPASVTYAVERAARRRWLRRQPKVVDEDLAPLAGLTPAPVALT